MFIADVLKYTLPAIIVFLTAYFLIKQLLTREIKLKEIEDNKEKLMKNHEVLLPVKLQAYERLILFMERIHPNQLVLRMNKPGLNAGQFQSLLIKSIRDEYEHNISQQLYVSDKAWSKVNLAKEECLKQINFAASKINSQAQGAELGAILIQNFSQINPSPISEAIRQLKFDVQKGL